MLMDRDKEIIAFLERMGVATTSILHELFFKSNTMRFTRYRLKYLVENKEINRSREHINREYCYYIKKTKQMRHKLLLSEFYVHLSRIASVEKFIPEISIEFLRPDALIGYETEKKYIAFVEVEISNNSIKEKIENYRKLYRTELYKKHLFESMPRLIIVTNRKVPKVEEFKVIQIKEDFSNIEDCLK